MEFNSQEERSEFIQSNLELIPPRVLFINKGVWSDDLYQEGTMGLIKAVDRFDELKEFAFSTYAVHYIDGYIRSYRDQDDLIKPRKIKTSEGFYLYRKVLSLDQMITDDGLALNGCLSDPSDFVSSLITSIDVITFIHTLNQNEQRVLNLLNYGLTQKQMSRILGICQSAISKTLKRIQKKYIDYRSNDPDYAADTELQGNSAAMMSGRISRNAK